MTSLMTHVMYPLLDEVFLLRELLLKLVNSELEILDGDWTPKSRERLRTHEVL